MEIRNKVDIITRCKFFLKNLKRGEQCHAMKHECSLKETLNNLYLSRNIKKVL
jgi:hypothetical protein